MPRFGPISRRELMASLRQAGFIGPEPGGKHELMVRERRRLFAFHGLDGVAADVLSVRVVPVKHRFSG